MKLQDNERLIYDRIDGLHDPSSTLRVYGHKDVENELASAFASGRMHHAWLINGPKGIGKATLAYRFANHIFHHSKDENPPDTMYAPTAEDHDHHQLAAGAHPTLLHLARPYDTKKKAFKSVLSVEEIRRTLPFFGMTATGGGWRIAIVDPADEMNASAANALLKILEEPPEKSLFLLICNAPGRLLPTIRSRCREINVRPLNDDDLSKALANLYGDDHGFHQEIPTISALAEGSVRKAVLLIEGDGLKNYRGFLSLIEPDRRKPVNWPAIHALAEGLSIKAKSEAYQLFVDMIMGFLARRVRSLEEPVSGNHVGLIMQSVPLAHWAHVWEKTANSARLAETFNLDKKQVILNIFHDINDAIRAS